MSIITPNDFIGEQTVAQTDNQGVAENLQWFIDKYEPRFLRELLGVTLYDEFVTGLIPVPVEPPTDPETFEPIPQKWLDLRDTTDIKQMLVCYVYYWYMRNNATTTAGTSEVKTANENSNPVNNVDKMVKAWNEMVYMARLFDLSTTTYPDYVRPYWRQHYYWRYGCGIAEIYYPINSLNI